MLINVPVPGSYIYITQTITGPEQGTYWSPLTLSGYSTSPEAHYQRQHRPINLEPGEWYRVKSICRPPKYLRNRYSTEFILTLALDSKPKDRRWVRSKMPSDCKITKHTFSIRIEDLQNKAECFHTIEALMQRLGKYEAAAKEAEQGRFSKIVNEQGT